MMPDSMKPTIHLTSKDLPEIKNWKVGESYDLIISVKQTGLNEGQNGMMMASFEIQSVMSAEKDPMDLEEINNIEDHSEFMVQAGEYREKHQK